MIPPKKFMDTPASPIRYWKRLIPRKRGLELEEDLMCIIQGYTVSFFFFFFHLFDPARSCRKTCHMLISICEYYYYRNLVSSIWYSPQTPSAVRATQPCIQGLPDAPDYVWPEPLRTLMTCMSLHRWAPLRIKISVLSKWEPPGLQSKRSSPIWGLIYCIKSTQSSNLLHNVLTCGRSTFWVSSLSSSGSLGRFYAFVTNSVESSKKFVDFFHWNWPYDQFHEPVSFLPGYREVFAPMPFSTVSFLLPRLPYISPGRNVIFDDKHSCESRHPHHTVGSLPSPRFCNVWSRPNIPGCWNLLFLFIL